MNERNVKRLGRNKKGFRYSPINNFCYKTFTQLYGNSELLLFFARLTKVYNVIMFIDTVKIK